MHKVVIAFVIALVVGLVAGFLLGRVVTERRWAQPYAVVSPEAARKSAQAADAEPTPSAGTKVLAAVPIGRARAALGEMIAKDHDPLVSPAAAFGADDDGIELHVVVENRGSCPVSKFSGVAYGFDPSGRPAGANAGGESYVAFSHEGQLLQGKKTTVAAKMHHASRATLALAHVDRVECADGKRWARP
jgi:hypothetical protein